MKRILPLMLTILLVPGMLAVPARADDSYSVGWVNLLDYGYIFGDSNSFDFPSDSQRFNFTLTGPDSFSYRYIDFLVKTDSTTLSFSKWNSGTSPLTCIDLGEGLYRFIGNVTRGLDNQKVYCFFSDGSYVKILSAKASVFDFARYAKTYSGYVYDFSYDPVKESFFSGYGATPMDAVNITPSAPSSALMVGHVVHMDIPDWQAMDYITVNIASWSTIVSSLSVEISGFPVPYTINTVESANIQGVSLYLIDIVIDLTNIDRTLGSPISIDLSGQVKIPYQGSFAVQSCLGLVAMDVPSTDTFWFTKLINSITSGFASIGTWISDQTSSLVSWLSQINTSLAIGFDGVSTWLSYVHDAIGTGFSNVSTWISNQTFSITVSISTWGQNIVTSVSTWGQNIVDAIVGNRDGSQLQDDLNNAVGSLDQAGEAMNSVQRPDIGQFDFDVSALVPSSGVSAVGSLVGLVYQNQVFGPIMLMFFTLSLAAFVIFGRR